MAEKGLLYKFKAWVQPDQWMDNSIPIDWNDGSSSLGSYPFLGNYLRIYRESTSVRSVISYRSENFASLPVKLYDRVDADTREALDDHALSMTFLDPNPEDSQYTFLRDLNTDLDIFDVTFWKKIRVGGKLLLIRMYPDAVTLKGGNMLAPEEFWEMQAGGGEPKKYTRDQVMWLHGYGGRRGISPMETLRREVEMESDEVTARRRAAKSGWRNAGVIERPADAPEWTETGRRRFLEQTTARYSGEGEFAGRPLLLEEDMTWKTDQIQSGQTDYAAARELSIKQVCMVYHVAPQLMGVGAAPYSSIVEYFNQLYKGALGNRITFVEQGFRKQLIPVYPDLPETAYVEFNIDAKLRGDPSTQAAIAATAVGKPYLTVNEWRAKILNLGPIEGGDVLFDPSGAAGAGAAFNGAPTPSPLLRPSYPSDFSLQSDGEIDTKTQGGDLGDHSNSTNDVFDIADLITVKADLLAKADPVQSAEYGDPALGLKEKAVSQLTSLVSKWQAAYAATGAIADASWKAALGGTLALLYVEMAGYYGVKAAGDLNGEYDPASTVNYWTKVSKEQAGAAIQQLKDDITAKSDAEAFDALKEQMTPAADMMLTRSSGWGVIEAARQNDCE